MSSEENMASTGENIENTAVNTMDSPSEEIPAEFSDVCYWLKKFTGCLWNKIILIFQ